MKIIDLNLLLYAVNTDAVRHPASRRWFELVMSSTETIALPWAVLLGFLRIATHSRILPRPLTPEQAIQTVGGWLECPNVLVLQPGPDHWRILRDLLTQSGTAGNLTTDAHLAALAIENGAELCSTDRDFGRFGRVKWTDPLATGAPD